MRCLPIAVLVFALAARCSFAQTVPTTPMDRTEILGRLATDYSPSYVAHLVKTRGLSFSVTGDFLDQVKLAGGAGILVDDLPHAASPNSMGVEAESIPSLDHLARCAVLIHTRDYDSANAECHAAIKESPSSPWPLLVTSSALQYVSPRSPEEEWLTAMRKEQAELLRQADALMPPSPPSKLPPVPPGAGGITLTTEQTVALASELLDNDEANSRYMSVGELIGFPGGRVSTEPTSASTIAVPSAIEISASLQARMQIESELASNHLSLAELYEQAHDYENARKEVLEAEHLEPDYERPHLELASLYLAHGDLNGAIAELREVVRIAGEGILERSALAHTLESAGKLEEAATNYKIVLARHPDNNDVSGALVDLYVKQKDLGAAIGELRRSLDATALLQPGESDLVTLRWDDENRLAQLLEINHDLEGASQQYLYLLRFRPDDPDLHNDYGMLLAQQKRCTDAMAEFNASIRLTGAEHDSSYPRSNLARCLAAQKDYAGALSELKSILESEPGSSIAENNVAWVYATADDPAIKNPAEALRLARLAVDSYKDPEPFMLDTLAEALLINGKPQEALEIEKKAVALDPANAEFQQRIERFEDAATRARR
jgi:tetratricopeptide (TPR) repeat protein